MCIPWFNKVKHWVRGLWNQLNAPGSSDMPPEIITVKSPPPSLFAVIIGINKYMDPAILDLRGAVNDANAVEAFLTSEVGVPKDRIVNLRDEEATRQEMLKALQNLAHNSAIDKQDPILIYYAGHGGEARLPVAQKTSDTNDRVRMLIPHDFGLECQGIFDSTLSQILSDIAMNKSDNITVIFDCCYASFGFRGNVGDETLAVRGIELPHSYPIVMELRSELEAGSVSNTTGPISHVLLAACKPEQPAMERRGSGVFTSALLTLLKQEGIDKLTYTDIITRLPDLPLQNPYCKGVNRKHTLFDSKVHSQHLTLYHILPIPETPNEYTLEAGEAHGITREAEFAIYPARVMASALGSVVAFDTTQFTSRCAAVGDTSFTLSQHGYALQTRVGQRLDIRLFIEPNDAFLEVFRQLGEEMGRSYADPSKRFFRLINNVDEQPDIAIRTHGGLVEFEIEDELCRQYGLTHMPFNNIQPDESEYLLSILRSGADFYRYLRHSNKEGSLTQRVHIECLELELSGELTDDLDDIFVPKQDSANLVIGGTIFVDVDDNRVYGYRILNTSETPLYVALFYFDVSDLSIARYHLPSMVNGQPEFCLPANGSLSIGFGDSPWEPRTYYLREGQSMDVGFLRLYITKTYIDYSDIVQNSPFGRNPLRSNTIQPKESAFGDALTIPIIQRRAQDR
ncbi:hypothetical protein DXG01_014623 [Tephrocybe rancida]|nr:hypothetical protein DXG01_014623 [Tephrocybe rancida]